MFMSPCSSECIFNMYIYVQGPSVLTAMEKGVVLVCVFKNGNESFGCYSWMSDAAHVSRDFYRNLLQTIDLSRGFGECMLFP